MNYVSNHYRAIHNLGSQNQTNSKELNKQINAVKDRKKEPDVEEVKRMKKIAVNEKSRGKKDS